MAQNRSFNTGKYDFLGKAKYIVPITLLIMVFGVVDIAVQGLNYGIDFAGGTEMQVLFGSEVTQEEIEQTVASVSDNKFSLQKFEGASEYLIRLEGTAGASDDEANEKLNLTIQAVTEAIRTKLADKNPDIRRIDTVGPQVGDELKRNGILAAIYSLIIILIYVGLRFDYKYAPAAVFCLAHDTLMVLTIFALTGHEVNLQTMAAILTLIGYSLNDTIVIFDRIRENEGLYPDQPIEGIVNKSINDTLSRTLLTALTTFFACATLYFIADGTIRDIAFTLGIGVILGTYSTVFIASPLMIASDRYERRRNEMRLRTAKA